MKYIEEDIKNLLYDSDLDLNKIIDIKKNLNKDNILSGDRKYLEELFNDELNVIDELDELEKIKQIFIQENFDASYIDKLIKRKRAISNDEIDLLNKEDLEYYIYDGSMYLDLDGMLRVKYNSNKYNYAKFDLAALDSEIKEKIESISTIDVLKKYKKIMIDYGFNVDYISKWINKIVEEPDDPLFIALDNYIASMPREVLEKVKENSIVNNEDTEIIDRAIKKQADYQRKIDEMSKEAEEMSQKIDRKEIDHKYEKQQKESKSSISLLDIITGVALGSFISSNNKNKKTELNGYESWNFEEEELEDDDYYYEDDD